MLPPIPIVTVSTRRAAHFPAQGLSGSHFRRVNHVVGGNRSMVTCGSALSISTAMAGIRAITRGIGHAGRHAVARSPSTETFAAEGWRSSYRWVGGGGVTDTVQGYGDAVPSGWLLVPSGTGPGLFGRVDHARQPPGC